VTPGPSTPAVLDADRAQVRDLTVIGAGPAGLTCAFWAGMREASVRLVDALPEIGGQLTALYPEKWIFDVPGQPRVRAEDLVRQLEAQALGQFDVPVHLDTTALALDWEGEGAGRVVVVHTDRGPLRSRALVVAGGHGAVEPRRLPDGDVDLTPWEGRGAAYVVRDKQRYAGRRVVVVGGGDSACDWTLNLLDTAAHVTLVHRRPAFRAHEHTVSQVRAAADAGRVDLRTGYVVREVRGDGHVAGVVLERTGDGERVALGCDELLLQLGFSARLGPMADWGLDLDRTSIRVDGLGRTSLERVWACGDITSSPGKLKLIATGFGEAAVAVAQAVRSFRPELALQPAYSTNSGVPGGAPGQP
jgi:thioredoxin reductase (NADPH)